MADNQQQAFQNAKRDPRSHSNSNFSQASLKRGFLSSQLWQYCRHPNFACEQITWYLIYAFTISATFPIELFDHLRSDWSYDWLTIKSTLGHLLSFLINYSIISPVCMTALFYSSTRFTEAISASKCQWCFLSLASYLIHLNLGWGGQLPWSSFSENLTEIIFSMMSELILRSCVCGLSSGNSLPHIHHHILIFFCTLKLPDQIFECDFIYRWPICFGHHWHSYVDWF